MATKNSDYNYQQDIENVLNAKIGWNNATTDEERNKQSEIANAARERLKAYGYKDIADQISASGADATATRKIFEQYSQPKTTTYPVETNNLKSNEVNRENAGSFEKHNEAYNYIMNTDPFKTSEAKAILGKYDLAGLQARDNAVASGGASNGGNIDSYASANAMRQQSALIRQGQGAVLDAHQQKIDNIRGILSDMGVNIDRVFNQDETAKNNNVARLSEQANVTGYVPNEWIIKNDDIYNQFLNEDGTFKTEKEGVDIQALINQAKASGDTETAKKLAVVRTRKILGNYGKFGQYSNMGDIASMTPQETYEKWKAGVDNETILKTLGVNSADKRYEIDKNAEINAYKSVVEASKPTLSESETLTALKNGIITQKVIDAYNYHYDGNYTVENPPKIKGITDEPPLTADEVTEWVDHFNDEIEEKYGEGKTALIPDGKDKYKRGDVDADYIIINIFKSPDLTQEQKEYLLYDKFGITEDQVNAVLKDPHYK